MDKGSADSKAAAVAAPGARPAGPSRGAAATRPRGAAPGTPVTPSARAAAAARAATSAWAAAKAAAARAAMLVAAAVPLKAGEADDVAARSAAAVATVHSGAAAAAAGPLPPAQKHFPVASSSKRPRPAGDVVTTISRSGGRKPKRGHPSAAALARVGSTVGLAPGGLLATRVAVDHHHPAHGSAALPALVGARVAVHSPADGAAFRATILAGPTGRCVPGGGGGGSPRRHLVAYDDGAREWLELGGDEGGGGQAPPPPHHRAAPAGAEAGAEGRVHGSGRAWDLLNPRTVGGGCGPTLLAAAAALGAARAGGALDAEGRPPRPPPEGCAPLAPRTPGGTPYAIGDRLMVWSVLAAAWERADVVGQAQAGQAAAAAAAGGRAASPAPPPPARLAFADGGGEWCDVAAEAAAGRAVAAPLTSPPVAVMVPPAAPGAVAAAPWAAPSAAWGGAFAPVPVPAVAAPCGGHAAVVEDEVRSASPGADAAAVAVAGIIAAAAAEEEDDAWCAAAVADPFPGGPWWAGGGTVTLPDAGGATTPAPHPVAAAPAAPLLHATGDASVHSGSMATTAQVGPPTPARLAPIDIVLPASAAAMAAAAGAAGVGVGSPGGSAGSGATATGAARPLADDAPALPLPCWADEAATLMTESGPVGDGGAGLLEDGLW